MAATVSYEVYSLREGHWNLDSVYDDRSLALDEARSLFQRRYEKGVKVIKEDYDVSDEAGGILLLEPGGLDALMLLPVLPHLR